nr:p39 BM1 [Hibiscus green spot virus 2]
MESFNYVTSADLVCSLSRFRDFYKERSASLSDDDVYADTTREYSAALDSTEFVDYNFQIFLLNGVPGGGKTKFVYENVEVKNSCVVVPFKALKDEYRKRGYRSFTQFRALPSVRSADILVIDEYTCVCYSVLVSLVYKLRPATVALIGDFNQCWIRDGEGFSMEPFVSTLVVNKYLSVCYRCPCPDVEFVRNYLDLDITPGKCGSTCSCTGFNVETLVEGMTFDYRGEVALVFSGASKSYLESIGVSAVTVRSFMGKQADTVALFILKDHDIRLLGVSSLKLVAFTRHVSKLVVYSDMSHDDVVALIEGATESGEVVDQDNFQPAYEDSLEHYFDRLLRGDFYVL